MKHYHVTYSWTITGKGHGFGEVGVSAPGIPLDHIRKTMMERNKFDTITILGWQELTEEEWALSGHDRGENE